MVDLHVAPLIPEIFGYQAAVAMMWLVFAAK
jgi:hypothetical protein